MQHMPLPRTKGFSPNSALSPLSQSVRQPLILPNPVVCRCPPPSLPLLVREERKASKSPLQQRHSRRCTEVPKMVCTCLREICSCSCLPILPGPAWVLLSKIYRLFLRALDRVIHLVDSNLPLTSKLKFRIGLACLTWPGQNGTFCFYVNGRFEST